MKKKNTLTTNKELQILRKIVDITSGELELNHVLSEIVEIISDITCADSVFIYLFDNSKENLVLKASKTPHDKELGKIQLKIGQGLTGWVAKENKPLSIKEKAFKDPRFCSFDILPEDKYEAFVSVPIIYKENPIGVINIQHKKPNDCPKVLLDLIVRISKQVSGVIENARLYEDSKLKALQFDSLAKLSETITEEKYLHEILDLIVVVTAELLNSKICSIMLVDEKNKTLSIKATQALSQEYKKKPNLDINNSLSGMVLKEQKPRAVYDVQKEDKYFFRELAAKEGLTSMLLIPMIVKNKAIGIVNVYTKTYHKFTDEEITILQIISNQAAVAIENTKLMEENLKVKEALETRKVVEKAKGILMKQHNLSEDSAYKMILKKSMDTSRPMKNIAEAIIITADLSK